MKRRLEDNLRLENSGSIGNIYNQSRRVVNETLIHSPTSTSPFGRSISHLQTSQNHTVPEVATSSAAILVKSEPGVMQTVHPYTMSAYSHSQSTLHATNSSHSSLHSLASMHNQSHSNQLRHKIPGTVIPTLSSNPGVQPFQRLKVEDALSYLDKVKFKFSNQPQVYNDFLDIMKEFKSQSIDTPGVIERVSNLFKGHPELIVGFNTFLPPGYKIEVSTSTPGQMTQTVYTPSGVHTQTHANPNPPVTSPLSVRSASLSTSGNITSQTTPFSVTNCTITSASMVTAPQNQPVEFNHAINYVNKIKSRFQGQPDIYKQFLEILHTYQKEQRGQKDGTLPLTGRTLTEAEVYAQVAKLFQNQEDLLLEFGQFLPDATNGSSTLGDAWNSLKAAKKSTGKTNEHSSNSKKPQSKPIPSVNNFSSVPLSVGSPLSSTLLTTTSCNTNAVLSGETVKTPIKPSSLKRCHISNNIGTGTPSAKRTKINNFRDISLSEAGRYGTLNEYAFFDRVRKALHSTEVYENFLRCLVLYNQEVVSRTELLQLVQPFLGRHPELLRWFRGFVGLNDNNICMEPVAPSYVKQERVSSDLALEIDYSTCKRLGASYCALPRSHTPLRCSGRTQLCRDVLNDTWVSFPSWSEDSTFVTSRKTQFEEYVYRCEDERFELDVVIETNLAAIHTFESLQKKFTRMGPEEASKIQLDETLGGTSTVIQQRAVKRIYGDKAADVIDGLKHNPSVCIPIVLRRLRAKDEEWREARKIFNKTWREQNEKYYLRSLDHQGITFKQTDMKNLRSKALLAEIETLYEERREQLEDGAGGDSLHGPHLCLSYPLDKQILTDAANLCIHHVKRQTGINKEEKQKIKNLLRRAIPDIFQYPRQQSSDDEIDDDPPNSNFPPGNLSHKHVCTSPDKGAGGDSLEMVLNGNSLCICPDDSYVFFMANRHWYVFLRLHQILCERLGRIHSCALHLLKEEAQEGNSRRESTAIALRLKPKNDIEIEEYYPTFLEMVRNLLDGNIESCVYEDALRDFFGIQAYIAYTLDKVISNAVRQLQHLILDKTSLQCTELFQHEQRKGATGGSCGSAYHRQTAEQAYQKCAEQLLGEDSCFKIYIYDQTCQMTLELLDSESALSNSPVQTDQFNDYMEKYIMDTNADSMLLQKPVFLVRNLRKVHWTRRNCVISDDVHIQLQQQSLHMNFSSNSQSFLYRRGAFYNARLCHRSVSERLRKRFQLWHSRWLTTKLPDGGHEECINWLLGHVDWVLPHRTRICTENNPNIPPYSSLNHYYVDWPQ